MIVEGKLRINMGLERIEFGAYELVYAGTKSTMKRRSVPEIALKVSNETGGIYFIFLYTVKRMHK